MYFTLVRNTLLLYTFILLMDSFISCRMARWRRDVLLSPEHCSLPPQLCMHNNAVFHAQRELYKVIHRPSRIIIHTSVCRYTPPCAVPH